MLVLFGLADTSASAAFGSYGDKLSSVLIVLVRGLTQTCSDVRSESISATCMLPVFVCGRPSMVGVVLLQAFLFNCRIVKYS